MNVKEAAKCAGTSVRTLRYYEEIGLISPVREENGYREYDAAAIERVRLIRVYRELGFSLEEVGMLLDAPRMERDAALERQIQRMEAKRQILENRIALAQGLRMMGTERFTQIDFSQVDVQMAQTRKYIEEDEKMRELSDRLRKISPEEGEQITQQILKRLADVANAEEAELSSSIEALKQTIEAHFGFCTQDTLTAYARAYGGDGILAQALEDIAGPGAGTRLRQCLAPQNI